MRINRVLAVIAVTAAMPIAPAAAATFTVTTTADTTTCVAGNCSLRGAVMAANAAGDADTIVVPAGTFTLSLGAADEASGQPDASVGDLDLLTPITLTGAGREQTLIDGGGRFRVLNVFGAGPTTVRGLTLQHGSVTDPANSGGAGIQVRGDGQLALDNIGVRDNSAISTVVGPGNGASEAGADACRARYPSMDIQTLFGAGIETHGGDNPTVTVTRSAIERNTLSDIVAAGDCNRSPRGGGISIGGGTMLVEDTVIRDNAVTVIPGPGLALPLAEYVPGGTGGGISVAGADRGATPVLTVRRSAMVGNRADGTQWSTGGGLAVSGLTYGGPPNTTVILENATVAGNRADGTSPGIATTRGPIHILASFSTFAGNVGGTGGYSQVAIAPDPWDNGMELRLRSSVIEAGAGSLACNADSDTVDHLPPTALNPARHTKIVSDDGLNLIAGDCAYGTFAASERVPAGAAQLAPLGGELVPAMAPLAGSPALNLAGACALTLDGRGYPRPLGGGCDSGAAERQVGIANLSNPTISGVPAVGTTVGVDPGSWTTHRATTAYQWRRCPITGTCTDIAGATGATYEPVLIDVGGQLQVVLTAASDDDPATATATSGRSGAVLATPPTPLAPGTGPGQKPKTPAKGKPRVRAAVVSVLASGCAKGAKGCAPSVVFRLSRGAKVTISVTRGKKVVYRRALAGHAGRNRIPLPPRLKAGSYAVTIRSAGGSAHTLRVAIGTLT